MNDVALGALSGKNILVVEDEYLLAMHVAELVRDHYATVIGPASSLPAALSLVKETPSIDAAVLDVNLRGERVYPVADALLARGVPFIFATGYEELVLRQPYFGIPRCPKPYDDTFLVKTLQELTARKK